MFELLTLILWLHNAPVATEIGIDTMTKSKVIVLNL